MVHLEDGYSDHRSYYANAGRRKWKNQFYFSLKICYDGDVSKQKGDVMFWMRELKVSPSSVMVGIALRMILPVLGLFFLGLLVDFLRQSTAEFALVGAIIGFLIATYLVYLQFAELSGKPQKLPKLLKSLFDHGTKKPTKTAKITKTK